MALRGSGKRAISHALFGKYSGAACLLNFRHDNLHGERVAKGNGVCMGRLPENWRAVLRLDNERDALYVVYSYGTPIAWRAIVNDRDAPEHDKWTIPDVKYSATTTNHQNVVTVEIHNPGHFRDAKW